MLGGAADDIDADTEEGDMSSTIKDLEFRLTNDLSKIQNEENRVHSLTLRQVNVLKVILCSGLYPQVGFLLRDSFVLNKFKRNSFKCLMFSLLFRKLKKNK